MRKIIFEEFDIEKTNSEKNDGISYIKFTHKEFGSHVLKVNISRMRQQKWDNEIDDFIVKMFPNTKTAKHIISNHLEI